MKDMWKRCEELADIISEEGFAGRLFAEAIEKKDPGMLYDTIEENFVFVADEIEEPLMELRDLARWAYIEQLAEQIPGETQFTQAIEEKNMDLIQTELMKAHAFHNVNTASAFCKMAEICENSGRPVLLRA